MFTIIYKDYIFEVHFTELATLRRLGVNFSFYCGG